MARFGYDDTITTCDEFAGVCGSLQGARQVTYVDPVAVANHDADAIHAAGINHPDVQTYHEDVTKLAPEDMPASVLYLASPVCPPWTNANGQRVDFDLVNAQQTLFGDPDEGYSPRDAERRKAYRRARLLMWEPLRYLRAKAFAGTPVLIGVIENVWQARKWSEFSRWRHEFHQLGYKTALVAFNSMFAQPVRSPKPPQSRNRLFLVYWHAKIGRNPDLRKWLDPYAWCPGCNAVVHARQVWKNPTHPVLGEMGCYGAQYVYQCPRTDCRREVHPPVLPALSVIDPTVPGIRIGDRAQHGLRPLVPATEGRIRAGARRYWAPMLVPTGGPRAKGTQGARPLTEPVPTLLTREEYGAAVHPLMVPVEGRPGKVAASAVAPMRTQTTRSETGVAVPPMLPFITPLRGGGDKERARSILDPLSTVTASGNHHGLALPPLVMRNYTARGDAGQMCTPADQPLRSLTANGQQTLLTWQRSLLLVPYYTNAPAPRPAASTPLGTLTTVDRYGLAATAADPDPAADFAAWEAQFDINDVIFRMLEDHEIRDGMGFPTDYRTGAPSKRRSVKLWGNAVTPAVMEVLVWALVECLTGEQMETAPCPV